MLIYRFPDSVDADVSQVGGKASSLLKGSGAGLPVPPGCALSVEFFAPWFAQLKASDEWSVFVGATEKNMRAACDALKARTDQLTFTDEQKRAFDEALHGYHSESLFAVRSSSPEEDLEGSSFAGGYETILGVTAATMDDAIRRAFASCLDIRVVIYKREHGFVISDPKIAVVIQEQIDSEVAGVGFSLNPVTNNYDEAFFNANWGLGETVVAGLATPDAFTVDKLKMSITARVTGAKETSIWLTASGGTQEKQAYRSSELTLSDKQIIELAELTHKVEILYQKPMDIEWAFSKNKLYLLQARPITAYVPLPPEMVTEPGQKKHLYLDVTISLQGLYKPISYMATEFFRAAINEWLPGAIKSSLVVITSGRFYLNLSSAFALAGKQRIVSRIALVDPLASKTIEQVDESVYVAKTSPAMKLLPMLLQRLPVIMFYVIDAALSPEQTHQRSQKELKRFAIGARELANKDLSITALAHTLLSRVLHTVFRYSIPLVLASRLALEKMKSIAHDADQADLGRLELALPNNVTTEMGMALFKVSEFLPDNMSAEKLQQGLQNKSLPSSFLEAWQNLMAKYGHRGPQEIDIAAPRYRDNPALLLDLVLSMHTATGETNPQEQFQLNQVERGKAYERLCDYIRPKGWLTQREFRWLYRIVENLGGYRETHKYYLVFVIDLLRERLLREAESLYKKHRLDSPEQVFDLSLDQLDRALTDESLDLIQLSKTNRIFIDRLSRVPQLPTVIDSRGLILRPPASEAREGETVGIAISAGVAKGRIKVLHSPDEKPLLKGEILVARATDPGWTPLFVNAAAVILEVGGVLQHGALVAREYGLPCVAGIPNVTAVWNDGTLVEVDGSAGIVRLLRDDKE